MNSLKCPRCGFVAWVDAAACKRCGAAVCRVDAPARSAAPGRQYAYAAAPSLPGWVELGLFSIKTRRAAMTWLVASAFLPPAVFFGALYFTYALAEMDAPVALAVTALGSGFSVFAPLWYWLSIRWMDAHDAWRARR